MIKQKHIYKMIGILIIAIFVSPTTAGTVYLGSTYFTDDHYLDTVVGSNFKCSAYTDWNGGAVHDDINIYNICKGGHGGVIVTYSTQSSPFRVSTSGQASAQVIMNMYGYISDNAKEPDIYFRVSVELYTSSDSRIGYSSVTYQSNKDFSGTYTYYVSGGSVSAGTHLYVIVSLQSYADGIGGSNFYTGSNRIELSRVNWYTYTSGGSGPF